MGDDTSISWTDSTWGIVRGCTRISAGCANCYAETMAGRFSDPGQAFHMFADRNRAGSKWTGKVELVANALDRPLRWRRPRTIFTTSMADVFHEKLTNEEIAAIFGVMAATPHHTYQVLTKRAQRMREWFEWMQVEIDRDGDPWTTLMQETTRRMPADSKAWAKYLEEHDHKEDACFEPWPLPNVWPGVSVENQEASHRIDDLIRVPAARRFLSCEPLIGPLAIGLLGTLPADATGGAYVMTHERIDWVIAGCESGPGARPCDVTWLRALRNECAETGTAFFLKQAEAELDHSVVPARAIIEPGDNSREKGRGPRGLPIIELPYLDGEQHDAMPEVQE